MPTPHVLLQIALIVALALWALAMLRLGGRR